MGLASFPPSLCAPPQPCTDGDPNLKLPIPPSLPAELFTKKDLGGTEHRDSPEDFLTEGEDEEPRCPTEPGPGGGEEARGSRELVLKRRKVSWQLPLLTGLRQIRREAKANVSQVN